MNNVALVIVDYFGSNALSTLAIKKSFSWINAKNIFISAHNNFFSPATYIPLPTDHNTNILFFKNLLNLSSEDYFLFINWDSFVCNTNKWQNDFFRFDCILTPAWIDENAYLTCIQDFCFFSRNALSLIYQKLRFDSMQSIDKYSILSNYLCLSRHGIKFASTNTALKFSFHSGPPEMDTFGVSGAANFPLFLSEGELIFYSDETIGRLKNPNIILAYLRYCLIYKKIDAFRAAVENFSQKPNLINALNFELSKNPNSGLLGLIEKFN